MIQFIVTDIFMLALGAVLYISVRALPRIEEEKAAKMNILDRLAHSDVPEKVDEALNGFLLKFLRRAKVVILRADNGLSRMMRKIKEDEHAAKPSIDFREMMERKKKDDLDEK